MKQYLALFPIFCLVGFGLEWCYGAFWNVVGTTPWIYPNSVLHYTSFEGIPLWGIGGLICILIYRAIHQQNTRPLLGIVPLLALDALWILFYSLVIA